MTGRCNARRRAGGTRRAPPRRLGNSGRAAACGVAVLLALLLAGCATAPKFRTVESGNLRSLLPPGADAYLSVELPVNRALVERLLSRFAVAPDTASMFLDRTTRLIASIRRSDGGLGFEAIAFGDYPSWAANFQLGFRKEWKRVQDPASPGIAWWAERTGKLELAIPDDRHLLLSNGAMGALFARVTARAIGAPSDAGALDERASARFERANIALLLPKPAGLLPIEPADAPRFPVKSFVVTLTPAAIAQPPSTPQAHGSAVERYNAAALFVVRDERDARLLSVLLRLFIASGGAGGASAGGADSGGAAGALPSLPFSLDGAKVQTEGPTLELSNITLTVDQIDELISRASGGAQPGAKR